MDLPFPHLREIKLSNYSTFGIGGPARYFAEARTCVQMQEMLGCVHNFSLPFFILGKGSNTLFDDRGFNGLVIVNRIDYLKQGAAGRFQVGSGYSFARLGGITSRKGWSGLEFASGIPATVGGAIYMNAGANKMETAQSLIEVSFVSESGEIVNYKKEALYFGYRTSSFQKMKGAIVEAIFQLSTSFEAKKSQKELLDYRLKTQPYGEKSAGCVFRNPQGNGAGQLIELCGLKGMTVGGAAVSPLHANFIVNRGGARAEDVLSLMKKIKEQVYQKKGVHLEEEIKYIPYA
jgi:UDP-N-acetylmuramate dehydrogenase